jgi:Outer membrane protein beta-barrel domain
MDENKFEKEVREKMDQLGFDPSDAVWANVDKEINKDKKRRRPIFWLVFPLILVLMVGGYYVIDKNQDKQSTSKAETDIDERNKKNEGVKKLKDGLADDKAQHYSAQTRKAREYKIPGKPINLYDQHTRHPFSDQRAGEPTDLKPVKRKEITSNGATNSGILESEAEQFSDADKDNTVSGGNNRKSESKTEPNTAERTGVDSSDGKRLNKVVENRDSVSDKKSDKDKNQKVKSSSWKIGFAGNAGFSNISQSLFKGVYGSNFSNNPGSVTGAPTGVPAAGTPSKFNAGFSFGLGVFVERRLSKRISFSAGIYYHYYSAKIRTGDFADSSAFVYSAPASGQGSVVNGYYRNGDSHEYTNNYHFVELPVNLNLQLNKSPRTPVIWEAGMSLSYLVGSNALHFDPYGNVYFENNQLINKTQLNGVTAIMVGFHLNHNELQLGPQLQYGLTGLLKSGESYSQHLFYYGLRLSIIPGKK